MIIFTTTELNIELYLVQWTNPESREHYIQFVRVSVNTTSMWQIESHTSLGWRCTSARCGRSSHIQAWADGVQVLALPGTGLSVWAVYTGRSSCWTTASSFRQPPSTHCSTVSARYVRPSHLRCRWTNDMELVPKQFAWAGHANWLFLSYTEDVSFWSVLGTLSALEAFLRQCAI